ncbi:two-component sensor [Pseudomonas aeruginosa]|nr:two-component sensor [Pseudomonas aeruginosa]
MARPSEQQQEALAGLLGLGSHSARKSHYPELLARLEELEAERNRYKWLFEHAVHGIFQASLGQGLRAANPALAQMLGYDDPQQVLWSLEDMAGQLFVGGEAEMRRIRALLRERGGLFGYETRLWRRDGSHIEVLMNLLLRHDEEELVEGFVADITERVQAQQRLQTMNEELERRVAERTHELEELNRQLRQARDAAEAANHSKDKYLAAASHDLLQPLNAARLLVDTLRERGLPAAELQLVERTHLALEGAETLLTDLLEIARLDQSAIRPDLDDYSLDELLAPLASEFEEVARAAGLALRARIPRLAVRTDARLLSRILRNLLSNACRYTERGSVLLGARRRGGKVRLEVWDTGRASPPTSCRRSSSSSTNWTPGALPSAVASGSGWPSSTVSPASSATASRCIRLQAEARCSPSRCRWSASQRGQCPARRLRGFRPAIRCRDGGCWWWTTRPRFSSACPRCSASGAARCLPPPTWKARARRSMAARRMRSWSTTTWTTALPVASCWARCARTTARRSPR